MRWYRPRDISSTLVLVGALMVLLVFTGTYLPDGPLAPILWFVLFFVVAALAPAPWVAPPAAVIALLIAVALAPGSEGGCPPGEFCEPVSQGEPIVKAALLLLASSAAGAGIRSVYDWQRRSARKPSDDDGSPPEQP